MEINWQSYPYNKSKKSTNWYWGMWTLSITLALLLFFLQKNYSLSLLVLVAASVITLSTKNGPYPLTISFKESQIIIDKEIIKIQDILSYNIEDDGELIYLEIKNKTFNLKEVPLPKNSGKKIEEVTDYFLKKNIEKNSELVGSSFIRGLSKFLGF